MDKKVIKNIDVYYEIKKSIKSLDVLLENETTENSFLFLFNSNDKDLNFDVYYSAGTKDGTKWIQFPANIFNKRFGSFTEKYMIKQLNKTQEIFFDLQNIYRDYPKAFKYNYGEQILVEMQKLLNKNMKSRFYEYYERFYNEIKKFITDFDINYPHPLIPKLDFPEIELLALLPDKNEFGFLSDGKFNTIFTNIDLGFLIAEWLNESNKNSYAAQLATYFHKYFVSRKGVEFKFDSLRTSITV